MQLNQGVVRAEHATLGRYIFSADAFDGRPADFLFTENESNLARLFPGSVNYYPSVRDAFHEYVIRDRSDAINPANVGTKCAAQYALEIPAGGEVTLRLRLSAADEAPKEPFDASFDKTFAQRIAEADAFYKKVIPQKLSPVQQDISRKAYAGLLWSKQFYHYIVKDWLDGDPEQPAPPPERKHGRNSGWLHVYNRDVLSMPDSWEYPWFAAWISRSHHLLLRPHRSRFRQAATAPAHAANGMHPNGACRRTSSRSAT